MKLEVVSREPQGEARSAPILFVHGMWHGAWCWDEHFMPYFAQHGYATYALSLRGHGTSEGRERLRWNTLANYVADVEQVAAQLSTPPVLIGHSLGGIIVQKYLDQHQAPVAVLLASAPPHGLLPSTLRFLRRQPLAFLQANLTLSMYPAIGTLERCREMLFPASMPDEQVAGYLARLGDESYRAYLGAILLFLSRPPKITAPLLVLGAADDLAISAHEVESTARTFGTQAVIFSDMAHDMMLEPGWQTVADRILAWLDERGL
ncbi:MAG: alpha/beta hydrolase [Anaerolineae bacterium]